MAKGNLFLGQARGKVGSVVFARAFGEQITRTRPTSVANPKTIGQNTQRAILATIAKSAAAMTSLVDHSFANVTYGAESVRHFRKVNMGLLRNLYLNTQNGANLSAKGGNFVPNPLKISEGNLPSFIANVDGDDIGFLQNDAYPLPSTGNITVETFLRAFPSLRGGDQITLVRIDKVNDGELIDGNALFAMSLNRIVFSPTAFDDPNAVIIAEVDGAIDTTFLDMTKTTDAECVSLNPATGGLGFSSTGTCYYAALILSRKVNNTWQRSTQYLEQMNYDDHTDNDVAIASYGATVSVTDATEYLNQAEEGNAQEGSRGAYMNVSVKNGKEEAETEYILAGQTGQTGAEAASGTVIKMSAVGFGTDDTGRKPFFTIYKGETQMKVKSGSIDYSTVLSADTAGVWKIEAVFADGSKAVYEVTLTVRS